MRGAIIAVLAIAPGVWAQTAIDGARLTPHLREMGPQPEDRPLHCDVKPMYPALDFGFRFETGFNIAVPMQQYFGPGHVWAVLTKVTPENGEPVWLTVGVRLPDVPLTTVVSDTFGGFLVGEGRYKVEWALYDDEGRVCRKHWKIEAKRSFGERRVETAIAPHTVSDLAGSGLPHKPPQPVDAPPFRLTVLLHAAPANPRRMHLRAYDRVLLLSTLSALVDQVQPTSVRLAVFNFDKQKVIYRNDDFTLPAIGDVSQALNRLELETIDVQTLGKPLGHVDLLESLINGELQAEHPPDAVVFLGPAARYIDKARPFASDRMPETMRFLYFQYRPFMGLAAPMLPDTITSAVSALRGRVFQIHNPGQFADAIRALERMRR